MGCCSRHLLRSKAQVESSGLTGVQWSLYLPLTGVLVLFLSLGLEDVTLHLVGRDDGRSTHKPQLVVDELWIFGGIRPIYIWIHFKWTNIVIKYIFSCIKSNDKVMVVETQTF